MTREGFNQYCARLPATTNVVQWGGASVWKVGGKIFAVCSNWGEDAKDRMAFKCSDLSYAILVEQEGFKPAPYLARAKWIQVTEKADLTDTDLETYLATAHGIVAGKLTKRLQKELGLNG